jgi:hypothetical protein
MTHRRGRTDISRARNLRDVDNSAVAMCLVLTAAQALRRNQHCDPLAQQAGRYSA